MNERAEQVSIRKEGETVRVVGVLTMRTVPSALQASQDMFGQAGTVQVDLAGLDESDSAALALLLEWRRQAQRHGGSVNYRHVPERLVRLARISELDSVLEFSA